MIFVRSLTNLESECDLDQASYIHITWSILPGQKPFLFLMQKSGKSDFIVTLLTLKNAPVWYFRNGIFHDDTFRSTVKYYTHQKFDIHLDLEKYIHVFGAFSTRFRYSKWTVYRAFTAYSIEFESHFIIYALAIHWHHLS